MKFRELSAGRPGESSAAIRARVMAARQLQHARFADRSKVAGNARMASRDLKQHCAIDDATNELLNFAMTDQNLSARAYDRLLKGLFRDLVGKNE